MLNRFFQVSCGKLSQPIGFWARSGGNFATNQYTLCVSVCVGVCFVCVEQVDYELR